MKRSGHMLRGSIQRQVMEVALGDHGAPAERDPPLT